MPSRGSGLEVAAARTTFSPKRTTAAPPACLASFPVSMESCFPPAISTVTLLTSGFIDHPLYGRSRAEGHARARSSREQADARRRLGTHFAEALVIWKPKSGKPVWNRLHTEPVARYLRMPSLEMTVLYRSESYFFK